MLKDYFFIYNKDYSTGSCIDLEMVPKDAVTDFPNIFGRNLFLKIYSLEEIKKIQNKKVTIEFSLSKEDENELKTIFDDITYKFTSDYRVIFDSEDKRNLIISSYEDSIKIKSECENLEDIVNIHNDNIKEIIVKKSLPIMLQFILTMNYSDKIKIV